MPRTPGEPPVSKVELFESLLSNFVLLPQDGPEAVYHSSVGISLCWFLPPPPLPSVVKIALSLPESNCGEVTELAFFPSQRWCWSPLYRIIFSLSNIL